MLRGVETVILDEVHAVAGTKRGAHLALSLERLERARRAARSSASASRRRSGRSRRSGASSPGRAARSSSSTRASRKELDLEVVVPVEDMRELGVDRRELDAAARRRRRDGRPASSGRAARSGRRSTRRCSTSSGQHRSTIVFVNNRRLAERLALRHQRARRGGARAGAPRLARARAAGRSSRSC